MEPVSSWSIPRPPCPYSQEFEVIIEVAVDAKSFAAVKALY